MKRITRTRVICVAIAGAMAAAMMTGCGSSSTSSGSSASNSTTSDADTGDLVTVNFVTPTAEASLDLAWLYAADGMGYFEDEGIKVNIIESTDGSDPKILASGQADFGGFSPSVGMAAVDTGADNVKAVANCVSTNHFGIAYNKDSGIKDWSDLEGQSIGFFTDTGSVIYNPIIDASGVDSSTVSYVNYGTAEYEALSAGQVDAMGTWLAEYYMCEGMGYDWGYLSGDDVLPQIANSLWVNTDYAEANPDIVKKFVKATIKGIYFTYLNPEAVADIVLTRYPTIEITWDGAVGSVKGNVAAMLGMSEEDQKEIVDGKTIGQFDFDKVQQTMQNLYDGGATTTLYDAEDYYTNEYVDSDIDYDEIAADSEAYEFTSSIYEEANS